ncbi:MAG TPA: MFS transporter [Amycolatopsis sp.]|nr:MFS transporter [Amycolatopsis sp.]
MTTTARSEGPDRDSDKLTEARARLAADPHSRRWWVLALCIICTVFTVLDLGIVVVALPTIAHTLDAGPDEVQWVVSGYALTFGIVPTIAGRLGDDFGQRPLLMIGITGFLAFSVLIGVAPNPSVIIVGRLLQGMTGGLIQPQVVGLVHRMFTDSRRGTAFGLIGLAAAVGTAAGPALGGLILSAAGPSLGWRLIFLVNVPITLIAIALCLAVVPRKVLDGRRRRLDVRGVVLLSSGLFAILFPAIEVNTHREVWLLPILAAAPLSLWLLYRWEAGGARERVSPIVDVDLFRSPRYRSGVGIAALYSAAYMSAPLLLSLFLQEGLGYSPFASGLAVVPVAIGAGLSAPLSGIMLRRVGDRVVSTGLGIFVLGLAGTALAALAVSGSAPGTVGLAIAGPLLVAGIGGGWVMHPNQALSLDDVDASRGSGAGGVIQAGQRLGGAVGTAVSSTAYFLVADLAASYSTRQGDEIHAWAFVAGVGCLTLCAVAAFVIAVRHARLPG